MPLWGEVQASEVSTQWPIFASQARLLRRVPPTTNKFSDMWGEWGILGIQTATPSITCNRHLVKFLFYTLICLFIKWLYLWYLEKCPPPRRYLLSICLINCGVKVICRQAPVLPPLSRVAVMTGLVFFPHHMSLFGKTWYIKLHASSVWSRSVSLSRWADFLAPSVSSSLAFGLH